MLYLPLYYKFAYNGGQLLYDAMNRYWYEARYGGFELYGYDRLNPLSTCRVALTTPKKTWAKLREYLKSEVYKNNPDKQGCIRNRLIGKDVREFGLLLCDNRSSYTTYRHEISENIDLNRPERYVREWFYNTKFQSYPHRRVRESIVSFRWRVEYAGGSFFYPGGHSRYKKEDRAVQEIELTVIITLPLVKRVLAKQYDLRLNTEELKIEPGIKDWKRPVSQNFDLRTMERTDRPDLALSDISRIPPLPREIAMNASQENAEAVIRHILDAWGL